MTTGPDDDSADVATEPVDLDTEPGDDDDSFSGSEDDDGSASGDKKRTRRTRNFPGLSFKEALFLAQAMQEHGSGQPIRRLTLFKAIDRSPTSSTSRALVTASFQYGLTLGSYKSDMLDFTQDGKIASSASVPARKRLQAQIKLAIQDVEPFQKVFEQYAGLKLPTPEVLRDAFLGAGVGDDSAKEAVEIFTANIRELGLVQTIAGTEHLTSPEAALEDVAEDEDAVELPDRAAQDASLDAEPQRVAIRTPQGRWTVEEEDLSTTCFIVSPIGDADSEQRKHADLILGTLIEPALQELGLKPVRADQISKPGLITGQVIEHIAKAALVIADLSFANPNVYYELALRHAARRPVVQITRSSDRLPFDVGQYRTVTIDMTDIYTLVPQIDLHRLEITRQCRAALAEGVPSQTQLSLFYSAFWDHIGK